MKLSLRKKPSGKKNKMKAIEKKENTMLGRIEYTLEFENKGRTISKEEALKKLVENFKANPELSIIKFIRNDFGREGGIIKAYVYHDKERFDQIEKFRKKAKKVKDAKKESKE